MIFSIARLNLPCFSSPASCLQRSPSFPSAPCWTLHDLLGDSCPKTCYLKWQLASESIPQPWLEAWDSPDPADWHAVSPVGDIATSFSSELKLLESVDLLCSLKHITLKFAQLFRIFLMTPTFLIPTPPWSSCLCLSHAQSYSSRSKWRAAAAWNLCSPVCNTSPSFKIQVLSQSHRNKKDAQVFH